MLTPRIRIPNPSAAPRRLFLPGRQAVIIRSWSGDILCPGRGLDTRTYSLWIDGFHTSPFPPFGGFFLPTLRPWPCPAGTATPRHWPAGAGGRTIPVSARPYAAVDRSAPRPETPESVTGTGWGLPATATRPGRQSQHIAADQQVDWCPFTEEQMHRPVDAGDERGNHRAIGRGPLLPGRGGGRQTPARPSRWRTAEYRRRSTGGRLGSNSGAYALLGKALRIIQAAWIRREPRRSGGKGRNMRSNRVK